VTDPILSARHLRVRIGRRDIVRGISLDVQRGQTLGIVGESGSGKSMTVLAATGLLDAPGSVVTGTSVLAAAAGAAPTELLGASGRLLRTIHGGRIGFVFQDPGTSLNPLLIVKVLMGHEHIETTDRYLRAIAVDTCILSEVLDSLLVGVPE